ncbi:hypothetical protein [Streptomyces hokutonensis]|uniref:hypothetical protein n=1 Tax=Streptomyces hokutonensis TaxID=1306990 RepID=UPI001319FF21|nr:hypothetical protein [Streptomyces hokutonensis]
MVTPPEGDDRNTVEVLGTDRPLLVQRWRALSRRSRVTVAVSTSVVVLTALVGYLLASRPPPVPPDPAAATRITILHVSPPVVGSPYFGITFRVTATSSVRLVTTDEGYDDLTLFVDTLAGTTLAPGEVRLLDGQAAVCTCQLAHPPRGTPLLYLTVRNARGYAKARLVPTDAQFDQIDDDIHRACAR